MIALEAATEHPEIFGKALIESPSLTLANNTGLNRFLAKNTLPARTWLAVGKREFGGGADVAEKNAAYIAAADQLGAKVTGVRLGSDERAGAYFADPEGQHNEASWAKHFGPALKFLFPAKSSR